MGDQWIDLFPTHAAPDLYPQMFDDALDGLARLLKARPDAKPETVALLERGFAGGLQRNTWATVTNRLANYWGEGPAYLLNWLVYDSTDARLAMLDKRAGAEVMGYLRSVVARFWDDLNASQYLLTTSVDDWSRIEKYVYYERLNGRLRFSINLTKVGGEVVTLESTADGILNLAGHLMVMIAAAGSANEFSPTRRSLFIDQLSPVLEMLGPEQQPAEGIGPPASGGVPSAEPGD